MKITRILTRFWSDVRGISSVEYALLLSFFGMGIILSIDDLSAAVQARMEDVGECLEEGDACLDDDDDNAPVFTKNGKRCIANCPTP